MAEGSGRAGKLLLVAPPLLRAGLGVQSPRREENASGSDRFPEVQLHYPEQHVLCLLLSGLKPEVGNVFVKKQSKKTPPNPID